MKQPALHMQAPRPPASLRRIRIWPRESTTSRFENHEHHGEIANPLFILGILTFGVPVLLVVLVVATNPGIQEGTLATLTMFLVFSAFIIGVLFEIKRLVDQPSESDRH